MQLNCKGFLFVIIIVIISEHGQGELMADKQPFIVSIQRTITNDLHEHICVGSIISKSVVLTAAHCFINSHNKDKYTVVGAQDILKKPKERHHRKVTKIMTHERFYPLRGYDAAVIKISPPFVLDNKSFAKVSFILDDHVNPAKLTGYLVGWGRIEDGTTKNSELVPFRSIERQTCESKNFKHLTKTEICAIAYGERGACDGDSGAPLLTANLKVQYGILSYAKTMCSNNEIYVFTKLSLIRDWIHAALFKL